MLGYSKRTYFLAGISLAQISEFSMILALVGVKLGHLDNSTLSMITFLGMFSILISSYFINYSEKLYTLLFDLIKVFEKKKALEKEISKAKSYEVILFGCNRVGYDFVRVFKKLGKAFLAVDFDPDVVKGLKDSGVNSIYGDAEDSDFLEELPLEKSKLVISTIPDFEINSFMLKQIRKKSEDIIVILLSYDLEEAVKLYEHGATYVVLPHFIGGEYAAALADSSNLDITKLHSKRNKHIDYLKERRHLGHSHPKWFHHF
jgi:voltage-gated potassium channel Kch